MFGFLNKKKTPAETLRQNKRLIERSMRELDRERTALQTQEAKLKAETKKFAEEGQMEAAHSTAKSIVRNRAAITKLHQLRSQLQAVSLRMAELKSTHAMGQAMQETSKAMAGMNKTMRHPAIAKIMRDFQKQNQEMDDKSSMMDDAMNGILDDGSGTEEIAGQELVNQVMDELGVNTKSQLSQVPVTSFQPQQQGAGSRVQQAVPTGAGPGEALGAEKGVKEKEDEEQLRRLKNVRAGIGKSADN